MLGRAPGRLTATKVCILPRLGSRPRSTCRRCGDPVLVRSVVVAGSLRPASASQKGNAMTTLSEVDAPPRRTGFITDRAAGIAASAAGILSVVIGILQVVFPQDEDPAIDPRTRGILVMFTLSLWALAVLFQGLAPHAQRRWGAHVASAGTILLTLGTLTSALNGIDLGIFPVIAMAANALWLVGAIALTVSLVRARP